MEQRMPTAEAKRREEESKVSLQEKFENSNRGGKRAMLRNLRSKSSPNGRFPSRTGTGTTPHFALWKADLGMKSALQRIRLDKLAESADGDTAAGFAILFVVGVKNVFSLTQKRLDQLLKLPGIELRHLEAIEAYLLTRNVRPAWTTAEGN